jgi:transposase
MPRAIGPRKIGKYPVEFKAKAVALAACRASRPGRWLNRWESIPSCCRGGARKLARAVYRERRKARIGSKQVAELKRLRQVEQENRVLREELTLLKKAIRFCSVPKERSTPSWNRTRTNTE